MEYIKISEFEIEITKEVITPTVTTKQIYERSFIESQIENITKQRDALIAIKEAELKECTDILAEMDRVGIVSKPLSPTDELSEVIN